MERLRRHRTRLITNTVTYRVEECLICSTLARPFKVIANRDGKVERFCATQMEAELDALKRDGNYRRRTRASP